MLHTNLATQTSIFLYSSLGDPEDLQQYFYIDKELSKVVTTKIIILDKHTALWNTNFIAFNKNDLQLKTESIL